MERSLRVLSPANDFSLISLPKAKLALKIAANDSSKDALLLSFIERASAEVEAITGRVFAEERVEETFRNINYARQFVYLQRWPVKNIESVFESEVQVYDWDIENRSGQLTRRGSAYWWSPIVVTYTGGYNLPENSPVALQQATVLLGQDMMRDYQQGSSAGVRMVSHKEARVMYYPASSSEGSSSGSTSQRAVQSLLNRFIRIEI